MSLTTHKMAARHEAHLAAFLGGRKTRGSGNQAFDQGDGKQPYREGEYTFCWDGKSTLGKSIGISREMWAKISEQSHWARPLIPLRFYADERLTKVDADLVVCDLGDFAAMQEDANLYWSLHE